MGSNPGNCNYLSGEGKGHIYEQKQSSTVRKSTATISEERRKECVKMAKPLFLLFSYFLYFYFFYPFSLFLHWPFFICNIEICTDFKLTFTYKHNNIKLKSFKIINNDKMKLGMLRAYPWRLLHNTIRLRIAWLRLSALSSPPQAADCSIWDRQCPNFSNEEELAGAAGAGWNWRRYSTRRSRDGAGTRRTGCSKRYEPEENENAI